jgi:hypothetical protein
LACSLGLATGCTADPVVAVVEADIALAGATHVHFDEDGSREDIRNGKKDVREFSHADFARLANLEHWSRVICMRKLSA